MRRWLLSACLLLPGLAGGCAICCAPFDCDYTYVGGRWVRLNPSSGRVGSAFDNAGAPAEGVPVAAAAEPTPAQPSQPETVPQPQPAGPTARSVIPRNLGESYLP